MNLFESIEERFDALLVRLFGPDLTTLPLGDEEFKRHIEANRMSLWLLVGMLLAIVVVTVISVYATLEIGDPNVQLVSVFTPERSTLVHVLPISAVAFSFAIIWRNVFNNYAAKFHSDTLKRQNSKLFASSAVFFALVASAVSFFADPKLYGVMMMLYYIALALAFSSALIFSSKMYHLVRSVAARGTTTDLGGDEAHQRFPALAHLTLGWCGTNALTTLILVIFSVLLLIFFLFAEPFHAARPVTDGPVYARIYLLEFFILATFLLMGFFSGTFRRKATADQFRAELHSLNDILDSGDGSGLNAGNLGANNGPDEASSAIPDVSASSLDGTFLNATVALLQSSRAFSSHLVAGLLVLSGGEPLLAMVLFLFLTSSYLFNDIMDFRSGRDLLCHPTRALPSGRLSQQTSLTVTVLLASTGMILSLAIGFGAFALVLSCFGISMVYSVFLKRQFPLVATPLWCAATVALFLYSFDAGSVSYLIAFCVVFGRELLLEERDGDGDKLLAISPTFPEIFGRYLRPISLALMLFGVVGAAYLATETRWLVLGVIVSALVLATLLISKKDQLRERSKIAYLLALAIPG